MEAIAKRLDKFLYLAAFLAFVHTLNFADDLLFPKMEKDTANKRNK